MTGEPGLPGERGVGQPGPKVRDQSTTVHERTKLQRNSMASWEIHKTLKVPHDPQNVSVRLFKNFKNLFHSSSSQGDPGAEGVAGVPGQSGEDGTLGQKVTSPFKTSFSLLNNKIKAYIYFLPVCCSTDLFSNDDRVTSGHRASGDLTGLRVKGLLDTR